jgi:signal peptidase I
MIPMEHQAKVRRAHITREIIEVLLLIIVITAAIKLSIDTRVIQEQSMLPGIKPSQLVMVNKLAYVFGSPQRGDVIIFNYPYDTNQVFIKRIIGVPGDTLVITPNSVTVNDHQLNEGSYISQPVNRQVRQCHLGREDYYVMGDNRPVSEDSRAWGVLNKKYIIGKVTFVYWPLNAIHGIDTHSNVFSSIPNKTPPSFSSNVGSKTADSCV